MDHASQAASPAAPPASSTEVFAWLQALQPDAEGRKLFNLFVGTGDEARPVKSFKDPNYATVEANLQQPQDLAQHLGQAGAGPISVGDLFDHLSDGHPRKLPEDLLKAFLKVPGVETYLRRLQEDVHAGDALSGDAQPPARSTVLDRLEALIVTIQEYRVEHRGAMRERLQSSMKRHAALDPVFQDYKVAHATPTVAEHIREFLQRKSSWIWILFAALLVAEGGCSISGGGVQVAGLTCSGRASPCSNGPQLATCGSWLAFVAACLGVGQTVWPWLAWRIWPPCLGTQDQRDLEQGQEEDSQAKKLLGNTPFTEEDSKECEKYVDYYEKRICGIQGHPADQVLMPDHLALEEAGRNLPERWAALLACKSAAEYWAAEIPWKGPAANWPQALFNLFCGAASLLVGLCLLWQHVKPLVKGS